MGVEAEDAVPVVFPGRVAFFWSAGVAARVEGRGGIVIVFVVVMVLNMVTESEFASFSSAEIRVARRKRENKRVDAENFIIYSVLRLYSNGLLDDL